MLDRAFSQWPEFITSFDMDPHFGYLIDPQHQVTSFNYKKIEPLLTNIQNCRQQSQLRNLFQTFPDVELKQHRSNSDMYILQGCMSYFLQYFLLYCRLINRPTKQSVLPQNIAVPLYISSNHINIKYGLSTAMQHNWIPSNQNYLGENFDFQDFQFRANFTANRKSERLFIGAAVITSFYLAKMNKLIFQINKIIEIQPMRIELIILRLKKMKQYWKIITQKNTKVLNQLDEQFFWDQMRPMVSGYSSLIFEKVQKGQEKILSATGGAGGNDPSYQIFQRGLGLVFEGQLDITQKHLRQSMSGKHIDLIGFFKEHSKIRQYCQYQKPLIEAYNSVILAYYQFMVIHSSFIYKFILKQIQQTKQSAYVQSEEKKKGTAGVDMESIMNRHKAIKNFCL